MKNKKVIFIVGFILIIICIVVGLHFKQLNNKNIPNDYIAIFNDNSEKYTYSTYIYKIDNGHKNMGFKYINITSKTESMGTSNWEYEINSKGEFEWTDGAFIVAKKHGAYSYVTLPNNNNKYSIEEFQNMFIMN